MSRLAPSVRRWAGTFARQSSNQLVVQVMAMTVGLLAVRGMAKGDYSAYGLVTQIAILTAFVADSGMSAGLLDRGARARSDRAHLQSVFASAAGLRIRLGIGLCVVACAWCVYLLRAAGESWSMCGLASLMLLVTAAPMLGAAVFQAYHRLEYSFVELRRAALRSGSMRFGGALFLWFVHVDHPVVWLAVNAVGGWMSMVLLRRSALSSGLRLGPPSRVESAILMKSWVRVMPMTVAIVASEQVTVAVAASSGGSDRVAELLALTRFTVVFSIINAVVTDVLGPVVARSPNDPRSLRMRFGLFSCVYILIVALFVLTCWVFRSTLLGLLGPAYSHLAPALVIVATGAGLVNMGHALNTVTLARGWNGHVRSYLVLTAMWALASLAWRPSTILGISALFATQALPGVLTQALRIRRGLRVLPSTGPVSMSGG